MTERVRQDLLHGDWLQRLPHYLFVLDLIEGKRVLELSCGDGHSSHYLANHGAGHVIGVDESRAAIERARAAYRLRNLEYRATAADAIQLEDASFDTVLLWANGRELRRAGVLRELRRLLAPGGTLVCSVASADRPAASGGVSYFELVERLTPLFAPIRMAAQTPFLGLSIVEFDGPPEPDVELDTSLLDVSGGGDEEVTHYLAVCGAAAESDRFRGFTIVQLPSRLGHQIVGAEIGIDDAVTQRMARVEPADDTRSELASVSEAKDRALRRLAETEVELNKAQLELGKVSERATRHAAELRDQIAMLEERLELSAAAAVAGSDDDDDDESSTADEWPPEPVVPDRAQPYQTSPTRPSMNQQVIEAMAVHAAHVKDLEQALDERQAYADELRDQLAREREGAHDYVTRLEAAEARLEDMRVELNDWRTRASVAAGEVLRLRGGGDVAVRAEVPDDAVERLAALEKERDEARDKLSRATENWRAAEAKSDEVWRKVGELQSQLEAQRESSQDAAKKARSDAQVALARAMDASSKKLVSVQDQLLKAERQRDQLEAQVHELSDGAGDGDALALSEVTSLRVAVTQLEDELAQSRSLLRTMETGLDKLVAAKPAGLPSTDLALQLGVRDAELTLMNVGIASLQQRLKEMADQVTRARNDMDGREPAQMLAIVDQLAAALAKVTE